MKFDDQRSALCRADFPALRGSHCGHPLAYLDGPGGSQVPRAVIEAMAEFYATCNVNTGGQYAPSREVDRRLWEARRSVATFLGAAGPECISFGQNMTTLCFSLAHAIGRTLVPGDEVLITELDHEANRSPWLMLRERGVVVREVRLQPSGELDPADMAGKVTARTRVLAIGASSNALGTVNDLGLARRLSAAVGALLVVDAVHYAPHFAIDVNALDTDFLLCSAYKFYGPHVGILYSRPGALERLPTDRLLAQRPAAPYRIETGTLNHAAIEGVRAAIDYLAGFGAGPGLRERLVDAMGAIADYEHGLASDYYERVRALPGVRVHGPGFATPNRAPTVSITLRGQTPAQAAAALGERGLCVWDGDFYAVRAVEVLGLASAGGLLRTGFSLYNTREEVDRLIEGLATLAG
ncbi:MAG: cysteine desulfurase-like protein [Gammaproteobacteria bacterium]|nr:cysteine desulfurase-like protein [Gammaproteobacteria bacterium]